MSKALNKVQLEGEIGIEPRLTYSARGTAKVWTKLIVDDGEYQGKQRRIWVPLTIWGELAEYFANAGYQKGDRIKVEGKYSIRAWKPRGADDWQEEHGVTVFAWEGQPSVPSEPIGEGVPTDDDPFEPPF